MSETHEAYKKMCKSKSTYYYQKRTGPGGIQQGWEGMLLKWKYLYLKDKLKYETLSKEDDYTEKMHLQCDSGWEVVGRYDEIREQVEKDDELIKLRRYVILLKIRLLELGYNKIYL